MPLTILWKGFWYFYPLKTEKRKLLKISTGTLTLLTTALCVCILPVYLPLFWTIFPGTKDVKAIKFGDFKACLTFFEFFFQSDILCHCMNLSCQTNLSSYQEKVILQIWLFGKTKECTFIMANCKDYFTGKDYVIGDLIIIKNKIAKTILYMIIVIFLFSCNQLLIAKLIST